MRAVLLGEAETTSVSSGVCMGGGAFLSHGLCRGTGGVLLAPGACSGAGPLLGSPLACAWPYSYPGLGQPGIAGPAGEPFRVLTTCSWEQSDTMVKVYVPLRGVQTDMLRATFHPTALEASAAPVHSPCITLTCSRLFMLRTMQGSC